MATRDGFSLGEHSQAGRGEQTPRVTCFTHYLDPVSLTHQLLLTRRGQHKKP